MLEVEEEEEEEDAVEVVVVEEEGKVRSRLSRVGSICTDEGRSFLLAALILGPAMVSLNIGFLVAFFQLVPLLEYSYPSALTGLLYLPIISLIISIPATLLSLSTCLRRHWHLERRIAFAVICVASLIFTHFFDELNLLGMHCWNGQ